jgi:predicted membrane metal-binding protein
MKPNIGSNRSFGIVFFIVFLAISLWPLLNSNEIRIWALLISLVFFVLGLLNSKILTPLNKIWFKFGIFLGNIVSPIVMGLIYFVVVTPIALLLKVFGKDVLSLKKTKSNTYWKNKEKYNSSMKNQF